MAAVMMQAHGTISIHAPARGATLSFFSAISIKKISIHAPARGATSMCGILNISLRFQSTLPRGERPVCDVLTNIRQFISIHAPARGATRDVQLLRDGIRFQSTLPRGERQTVSVQVIPDGTDFNPRSREGSDAFQCGLS